MCVCPSKYYFEKPIDSKDADPHITCGTCLTDCETCVNKDTCLTCKAPTPSQINLRKKSTKCECPGKNPQILQRKFKKN